MTSPQEIISGVPQGFILGFLLFLLYLQISYPLTLMKQTLLFHKQPKKYNPHLKLTTLIMKQVVSKKLLGVQKLKTKGLCKKGEGVGSTKKVTKLTLKGESVIKRRCHLPKFFLCLFLSWNSISLYSHLMGFLYHIMQ